MKKTVILVSSLLLLAAGALSASILNNENSSSQANYNHKFYCSNSDCGKYIGECGRSECHTTCKISTTCGSCEKKNEQTKRFNCD
jgi:hypothetical protein